MKNSIILLILLTTILSCKSEQQATATDNSIFKRSDSDSLFISISRSVCFGKCPWFEAKIYESGYVTYEGKRNVPNIGHYFFYISADQLKALKQKAIDISYFEMQDKYDNERVTDLPDCITSVQLDGKRKTIKNRFQGPVELAEFEKMIDALFEDAEMKKSTAPVEKND